MIDWIEVAALVVAVGLSLLVLGSRWLTRWGARSVANMVALSMIEPEYEACDLDAYPGIDRAYYDRMTTELEALGFVPVGDVHNLALRRRTARFAVPERLLLSADGEVIATAYHLHLGFWMTGGKPQEWYALQLSTELDDGRFVAVSNLPEARDHRSHPFVMRQHAAEATPAAGLRDQLALLVRDYRERNPSVSAVRLDGLAEVLQSLTREHALEREFRRMLGGTVTAEEMARLVGGDDFTSREFLREIKRAHASRDR